MKNLLEIRDLHGGYTSTDLLRGINLQVNSGEIVGLIGPNGCGKTTVIRYAIGIRKPRIGRILLGGNDLFSLTNRQRGLAAAYLPQDHTPGFDYTLGELVNLGRFPHAGGGRSLSDKEAVSRALRYVGLVDKKDEMFSHLSGGERQRGLFARALAQETPLLILDEPSSSLDLGQEHRLFAMLRELAKEGRGILVAVHNLNAAAEFCDRILLMDQGLTLACGSPDRVLTPELLGKAYRSDLRIGRNDHTGSLLVFHGGSREAKRGKTVHLIGGAGSAVNLTRHLVRLGYSVTGGVTHAGDTDAGLWESLGLDFVREEPFNPISEKAYAQAAELVGKAWLTVLCDFPLGTGNLRNLELAEEAENLVILQGPRSVFLPDQDKRLPALGKRKGVRILREEDLVAELENRF